MVNANGNTEDIHTISQLTNLTIDQVQVTISKHSLGISCIEEFTSASNACPAWGSSTQAIHVYRSRFQHLQEFPLKVNKLREALEKCISASKQPGDGIIDDDLQYLAKTFVSYLIFSTIVRTKLC